MKELLKFFSIPSETNIPTLSIDEYIINHAKLFVNGGISREIVIDYLCNLNFYIEIYNFAEIDTAECPIPLIYFELVDV